MLLKSVFVRFYKSFNYDYLRKINSDAKKKPWEEIDQQFYPYIEIPLDPQITAIVGANESGKSHLLTAIEKGLTGKSEFNKSNGEINKTDFCRYSPFNKSTIGVQEFPDFGFEWMIDEDDVEQIKLKLDLQSELQFNRFFIFRTNKLNLTIYIPAKDINEYEVHTVSELPDNFLPNVFRINSDLALPDSVSISRLIKGKYQEK